ncbi:hypothetical protein AFCDBAGC_2800 [Methylobacterium cerastii]|uniref:Uncharacterized protein n=1 Tax=Methylobacterium cerastii TaxID=932741 RepID=A0ABQ4QJL7_9HYPH|nr:hypothetical protein AFCDBAGC_2800 [Methylobacterium cerastii]
MQVWPALRNFENVRRSAVFVRSADGSMIVGDLPPSSSVTGIRLRAAASATLRPTGVEPVNSRWSKGSAEKALAPSAPPVTTATSSASKYSATLALSRALRRGVSSDGLIRARLPAASAATKGGEGELERVVPGRDDADDAERLGNHLRGAGTPRHLDADAAGLRPAREAFARVPHRGDLRGDLRHDRDDVRTGAEVRRDRGGERGAVLVQHRLDAVEPVDADRARRVHVEEERRLLRGDQAYGLRCGTGRG